MAPPFPFFPSGMPMPPNMAMPPLPGAGDGAMSWFGGDPMLAGGMGMPSSMNSKLPADYHDENKDIFGKPVNKAPTSSVNYYAAQKSVPSVSKGPNKPDLFEPQ